MLETLADAMARQQIDDTMKNRVMNFAFANANLENPLITSELVKKCWEAAEQKANQFAERVHLTQNAK
ncbi:MAG: hypothetical protein JNM43_25425 [Planctomycetaceae bacterium]|nr:hypothetical protein [Planctomycetaceae bacterium]